MPRGEDVGAVVELGCPATAVVPRVLSYGKPPIVLIREQMQPNLLFILMTISFAEVTGRELLLKASHYFGGLHQHLLELFILFPFYINKLYMYLPLHI